MKNILFICTHNRCRSILGEAITRQICDNHIGVRSAGSAPAGVVHPETIKNLRRHGYITKELKSQSWNDLGGFTPDITITVCDNAAKEACPLWLGKSIKIHWGLPDPTHGDIQNKDKAKAFDQVIQTLEKRIDRLKHIKLENKSNQEIESIFKKIGELL